VPHTLVAAQAPVPEGLSAWWNTITLQGTSLILMLTKEVERGMLKADRYWPATKDEPLTFGPVEVHLEEQRELPDLQLVIRTLRATRRGAGGTNSSTIVTQVQYLGWPDHGIPASAASFHEMIKILEGHPTDAPVIVHCSAGIGRTGTLIGFYAVKKRLESGQLEEQTVFDVVRVMKSSRRGMVQRFDQYYFIYQCLMESLPQA
jgi:protein-tyrosine phosphatase